MERIGMSQEERDWLDWLKRARDGKLTQKQAAERMGVTERWVRKLLRRMKTEGDRVVVHGLRGRASNRQIGTEVRMQALQALQQPDWHDFAPTFAAEQLAKQYDIRISDETLRHWMIEAGMWKPRARRVEQAHSWRPRRSGFGELVQWDTSEHDWLEKRGPVRYLVRFIDDATSWSWGRFVEQDSTRHNMAVLWEYLEKNGRMLDVYTDRDSMFVVPPRAGESEQARLAADRLTQIGRGLRELGIGWVAAYSPQAKGRVERSFLTAQDRLVKQLRLAKITTLASANTFLETEYWPEWNARFARPLTDFADQHRPLSQHLNLAAILSHVEERVIGNDHTFCFAGRRYQIVREQIQAGMQRQRLRLELRLNGELHARYKGGYLSISECGARPTEAKLPAARKPVRKDHNAGGKSAWMKDFFDRPCPPLWMAIQAKTK